MAGLVVHSPFPPGLILNPAPLGVKCLELPTRLDCLAAVCLAPHCAAGYDGHIPTGSQHTHIT